MWGVERVKGGWRSVKGGEKGEGMKVKTEEREVGRVEDEVEESLIEGK